MHLIKSFLVFLSQREGFSRFNKIYEYDFRLLNQNCAMVMTSVSGHLLGLEFVGQYRKWFVFSVTGNWLSAALFAGDNWLSADTS